MPTRDWFNLVVDPEYARYLLRGRERFAKTEIGTVQDVRKIYERAADAVGKEIIKSRPGTASKARRELLYQNLKKISASLTVQTLEAITVGLTLSIEAGMQGPELIAMGLLQKHFRKEDIQGLFAHMNQRALASVMSKTYNEGLKLSDRIWRTEQAYRNSLRVLIEDGVARGLDSRKLAKEVQHYLQPGVFTEHKLEVRRRLKIPASTSMEGMRVARTELNNAFHDSCAMANQTIPSYEGSYWRLSGSHPVPDMCDEYAKHNGDGFWLKGTEPVKPHPHCLCVLVPRYINPKDFAAQLNKWVKNPRSAPELERWYNSTAKKYLPR